MKTYYLVTRRNTILGTVHTENGYEHAVELMREKYGADWRSSDCVMESSEYVPTTSIYSQAFYNRELAELI